MPSAIHRGEVMQTIYPTNKLTGHRKQQYHGQQSFSKIWDIVITHCEEKLDWLERLQPQNYRKIYIYHKGGAQKQAADYGCPAHLCIDVTKLVWIPTPNLGREGATILTHSLRLVRKELPGV